MRIVVWTPTARPGFDVVAASIARQTVRDDIYWIVGDDYGPALTTRWADAPEGVAVPDEVFRPRELTGAPYCLDAGHNEALRRARALGADLFVSMMDYTWIAPDGVQRFVDMAARHPDALLTGIAHTSQDPPASAIVDPDGAYTIFAEPYTGKPEMIGWEDVRLDPVWRHHPDEERIDPTRWEFNWAAIPRRLLHDERLHFDETYDRFHACDNIDFAIRANLLGYETWIDYRNVALRLPRRTYWPEEQRFKQAEADGMHYFHNVADQRDRLELGSGDRPTPGYVHLDIRPDAPQVDVVGDATDLDAAGIGFVKEIRACHILEHISHRDTVRVLKHWRSHIWPYGGVHIEVPNLAGHIARWEQDGDDAQLVWFLFGEQDHPHNFHRTMFTKGSLTMALLEAGFGEIQVVEVGSDGPSLALVGRAVRGG